MSYVIICEKVKMPANVAWSLLPQHSRYRKSVDTAAALADLPERYSVSVPPVTNNIYRSAVPAPNYLPERRSGTTTALSTSQTQGSVLGPILFILYTSEAGDIRSQIRFGASPLR